MAAGNDEGRPRQGDQSSSNSSTSKRTRKVGQPLVWHAVAKAELVTARTGRQRWLLLYRCHCGTKHLSHARTLAESVRRTTACGEPVLLHITGGAGQVAA
jgi:hypothetical protein